LLRDPIPPTFAFAGVPVVGKAVVTGRGRGNRSSSAATVSVEQIKALVNFDVPQRGGPRNLEIKTFDTPEEMEDFIRAHRGKGGF
jgi:hypothetical protein